MPKLQPLSFSYLRFSKPEQARGDSVRRQLELAADWSRRNGARLDESLTIRDEGVSGYSGRNRSDKAALGAFLTLVRAGQVPRGSYLIVESLDRLSREEAVPALSLLLELLQAGVRVVQLLPAEVVYDEKANPMALMLAIAELSRGHSESRMKAERCGRAWSNKKKLAAETKVPITRIVPAWVEVLDGKFRLKSGPAAIVRRIYRLATEGWGIDAIVKTLNSEGLATIGNKGGFWSASYVGKILSSRRAVGEYQPHRQPDGRGTKRVPDGPPIPSYFPAVVTEEEWATARRVVESRRHAAGRRGNTVNLFKGLVTDARTRSQMHMMTQRSNGPPVLFPYAFTQGLGKFLSFPLPAFEDAVLNCLSEIDPAKLTPRSASREPDKSDIFASRLADLSAREEKVKARMLVDEDLDALADVLRQIRTEKDTVVADLAAERKRLAGSDGSAWTTAKTLIGTLDATTDLTATRTRLASLIRQTVSGIWMLVVKRGEVRLAMVQIWLTAGSRKEFVVANRPEKVQWSRGNERTTRPGLWWVIPGPTGRAKLDLRVVEHFERAEKWLGGANIFPPSESS